MSRVAINLARGIMYMHDCLWLAALLYCGTK